MQIVIFGWGVTGNATGTVFEQAGHEVFYDDPPKGLIPPDGLAPAWVFLCVPTPTGDLSFVRTAAKKAAHKYPGTPIVIRSTVPSGTHDLVREDTGAIIVMMPEFLREKTAVEDALRKDRAIYATEDDATAEAFNDFLVTTGYTGIMRVPVAEAEIIKFATNCLIATIVSFANVIYSLCEQTGADYETVKAMLASDGRFGSFGLRVPGDHGLGYSGTCLPKDMGWLKDTLSKRGLDLGAELIQNVQDFNEALRGSSN